MTSGLQAVPGRAAALLASVAAARSPWLMPMLWHRVQAVARGNIQILPERFEKVGLRSSVRVPCRLAALWALLEAARPSPRTPASSPYLPTCLPPYLPYPPCLGLGPTTSATITACLLCSGLQLLAGEH